MTYCFCYYYYIIIICLFISHLAQSDHFKTNVHSIADPEKEQLLISKLFKAYNRRLKPSGTIEIKFALNLNQIVNLIEKEQIIVLNVFLDHEWIDTRLKWDPAEHNNITLLRVSCEQIWT